MRLDRLILRAFGPFTDDDLIFQPDKNFHLLYGLNEAGKSTALRAIVDFLYGIPTRTSDAFLHDNKALRIEGTLSRSDGKALHFVRRKGNKNTVLGVDGQPLPDDIAGEFLSGLPRDHFMNMFALDHARLREGGESLLQNGGSLGESLFSAASGITRLRKVLKKLDEQSGDIFRKRATHAKLNRSIREMKQAEKELADRQLKIRNWKALEKAYAEGKQNVETIKNEMASLSRKQKMLERVTRTLPKRARLKELEQRLDELSGVRELPDDAAGRRIRAENAWKVAEKDLAHVKAERDRLLAEQRELVISTDLIEQAPLIDALYREVNAYRKNLRLLPEQKGTQKQIESQMLSEMKALDPANAAIDRIDRFRLPAAKQAAIRKLCGAKPLLEQHLAAVEEALRQTTEEIREKSERLAALPELPAADTIEQAVNRVSRDGRIEEEIQKLSVTLHETDERIKEAIRQLPLWHGSREQLIDRPVRILMETINTFEQEKRERDRRMETVQIQMRSEEEKKSFSEQQIRRIEAGTKIPSEDELGSARSRRDEGWKWIRNKLETGAFGDDVAAYSGGRPVEQVYEEDVRTADQMADRMRIEAAKVGEKNKYMTDIEISKNELARLADQAEQIKHEAEKWTESWHGLWAPYGIVPRTPAEMKDWLTHYDKIKEWVGESERMRTALKTNREKLSEDKQLLRDTLSGVAPMSGPADPDARQSLEDLLTAAQERLRSIQKLANAKQNLASAIETGKKRKSELEKEIETSREKLREWKDSWLQAIDGTPIGADTSADVADQLLARYEQLARDDETRRRMIIEREQTIQYVRNFQEKIGHLQRSVSIGDVASDAAAAVLRFYTALQETLKKRERLSDIHKHLKVIDAEIEKTEARKEEAEADLSKLFRMAGCTTIEQLERIEQMSADRKAIRKKAEEVKENLLTEGSGMTLDELIEEAERTDRDSIPIRLAEVKRTLAVLESERSECEQAFGAVKKEYLEKVKGTNTSAVLAEQKKESQLAELSHLTEQYIRYKLASLLLQRGIDDYRSRNQDPILKRAGELFSRLTLRSFSGIAVDYDEKDQPVLTGTREQGRKVPIRGMSDGSADQLYLALRIASIEKYISQNEPIPLIVDDILIHFDDQRAEETLKVLLELSRHTQIIFFTHHEQLVHTMNRLSKDDLYQLFELNGEQSYPFTGR